MRTVRPHYSDVNSAGENVGAISAAAIEAGRRLFAGNWSFRAAGSLGSLPPMAGPEIAFAGRSNVGKSSLINALTGRRSLARTSNTPGRTRELIFFSGAGALLLVDMPGYGYAAAAKAKVSVWARLIDEYLRGRPTLARVYLLVDARHGLMQTDDDMLDILDRAAVSYQIVLAKSDLVSPSALSAQLSSLQSLIRCHAAAYPTLLTTSARTGGGIADLRAAIARLLRERGEATFPGRGAA